MMIKQSTGQFLRHLVYSYTQTYLITQTELER